MPQNLIGDICFIPMVSLQFRVGAVNSFLSKQYMPRFLGSTSCDLTPLKNKGYFLKCPQPT